ncbi:MAG: glycoside hydrolase family 13 protein [Clostridia bacterium]|nr:glycoside hydrolase family 13 protein [Clostridia bacterium]
MRLHKDRYDLRKRINGRDVSIYGAFPAGVTLTLEVYIPRNVGASDPILWLWRDNCSAAEYPLIWKRLEDSRDYYTAELPLDEIGLYFYRITYGSTKGEQSFPNQRDGGDIFQLTVHAPDFDTPKWLRGGIMYQIFPDRFCRAGNHQVREGAYLDSDWDNSISQYGEYPGAPVANNVFFGGDLEGIASKLDYIASLGVSCIYLNPIFEAASNHRYDTGDFEHVDPLLGGDSALDLLLDEAKKRGIRVILDGVFNHTGADSRYFNRFGRYDSLGAYQSKTSPYAEWYSFKNYPDDYDCWWGVKVLPSINEASSSYREYICGEDGIARQYLRRGISGWRLDVADELPDDFVRELRAAVKAENPDALLLGEVWEDASNKIAYDIRREYLLGGELDSVMNYPLKDAVINFVLRKDSDNLSRVSRCLYEHYPKCVSDVLMNFLGTHDTERILTILGGSPAGDRTNAELSSARMTEGERSLGIARLKLAWLLLSTLPGVPCIYYGDEAGMEGYRDPFNRLPYPWDREEASLVDWFRMIGCIRREEKTFAEGDFRVIAAKDGFFAFKRDKLTVAVNAGDTPITCPINGTKRELIAKRRISENVTIEPLSGVILK